MPSHRRTERWPFVRRSRFLALRRDYEELLRHYRTLADEHDRLSEPEPEPVRRRVPSWARTEPVPVITSVGLDPARTTALLRRWGMAGSPAGSWGTNRGTTG